MQWLEALGAFLGQKPTGEGLDVVCEEWGLGPLLEAHNLALQFISPFTI